MRYLWPVLLLLPLGLAHAIVEVQDVQPDEFSSPEQKLHFRALIQDLRCTVCQNQNLADSHASLARDLRRQILELMQQGKSDEQIIQHLVNRYGEFVLYKPRFEPATYVLWVAPFVALIAALSGLIVLIRRRAKVTATFSDAEKQALAKELNTPASSSTK
ncbi:MAG: cytochrome c-type biogenesis protein CcmH [Gammaproteobacteria bacterium]|nr:cytochrome c-type biogenesis protein CcmH [Gammaproteobacteria bacterium]